MVRSTSNSRHDESNDNRGTEHAPNKFGTKDVLQGDEHGEKAGNKAFVQFLERLDCRGTSVLEIAAIAAAWKQDNGRFLVLGDDGWVDATDDATRDIIRSLLNSSNHKTKSIVNIKVEEDDEENYVVQGGRAAIELVRSFGGRGQDAAAGEEEEGLEEPHSTATPPSWTEENKQYFEHMTSKMTRKKRRVLECRDELQAAKAKLRKMKGAYYRYRLELSRLQRDMSRLQPGFICTKCNLEKAQREILLVSNEVQHREFFLLQSEMDHDEWQEKCRTVFPTPDIAIENMNSTDL